METDFQDYSELLLKNIDGAASLEDLGFSTMYYLLHVRGIDKRYLPALSTRVSWVNGHSSTLDEAGKSIGVTRERIRQVEAKLKPIKIDLVVAPKIVYSIIGIMGSVDSWEDFCLEASKKKISSNIETWSLETLGDLIQIFNVPKSIQQFNELFQKLQPISIDRDIASTVRGYRNALGLVDLQALSNALGETTTKCLSLLKMMYPYVVVSNNLVMANQRQGGSVTNILLKQLSIKSPLLPKVLVEGVERACGYRRTPMIGSQEDLEKLVTLIAGDAPGIENINSVLSDDFELGDIEMWLQQVIGERAIGIIHRDELTELAISDGVNPSSIGAYLSFSTIIRNVSPGIFALVGTEVDESVVESYRKRFLAEYVPASFEYRLIDERKMELSLIPNTALYTGGSLSISSGLTDLVGDFRFSTKCMCAEFFSEADIRIAPSGYWVGFTALLMHSRNSHAGAPGNEVKIVFDFYDLTAVLLVGIEA